MNSLAQLQQRKAALKAQIEQQRIELKNTYSEVRKEIEPSFLLKKALQGLFNHPAENGPGSAAGFFERFPLPVSFLVDLFVKNKAVATLLKLFAPAALKIIPLFFKDRTETDTGEPSEAGAAKAAVYGQIRHAVASLRSLLNRNEEPSPETQGPIEN